MGVRSGPKLPTINDKPDRYTQLLVRGGGADESQTFTDSSVYGRTITASGNVKYEASDGAGKIFNIVSGIEFDGTGDYLTSSAFNFLQNKWTVECWFYYDTSFPGTVEGLIALDYDGSSGSVNNAMNLTVLNGAMALYVSSDGMAGGSWNIVNGTTGGTVSVTTWHHAAAVFDGSTYKVYLDGAEVISVSSSVPTGSTDNSRIIIGTTADSSSSQSWDGYIDEVRVSSVARYTAGFRPESLYRGPFSASGTGNSSPLILCLDAMNAKSFAGEPTSNLCTSRISDGAIAFSAAGTNSPLSLTVTAEYATKTPFGNTAYKLTFAAGGSHGTGYAAERAITGNWTVDRAKTYSYGIWIAFNNDYAKYRFEVAGTIYGYITGGNGMASFHGGYGGPAYIDAGGKRWYHYGRTAQTIGSSGTTTEFWVIFRNAATYSEECTLWVCGPQFEEGSSFTPFTSTSRAVANSWKDLSGKGNHGTHSAEDFGNADDVSLYKKGQIMLPVSTDNITSSPAAINFDGSDDYVDVGDVNKGLGNGSRFAKTGTMCIWLKPETIASDDYVWQKNDKSNSTTYVICKAYSTNRMMFRLYGDWGWSPAVYTNATDTFGDGWHHLVTRWYPNGLDIWKDGNHHDSAVESGTWGGAGANTIRFGNNSSNDGGNGRDGQMACIQLYDVALNHQQIKDLYNSQKSRFGR